LFGEIENIFLVKKLNVTFVARTIYIISLKQFLTVFKGYFLWNRARLFVKNISKARANVHFFQRTTFQRLYV
jgi:hypothetical protein